MRIVHVLMLTLVALLTAACPSLPPLTSTKPEPAPATPSKPPSPPTAAQLHDALTRLNKAFQEAYERILDERGTRHDPAGRAVVFQALDAALRRLGMIVESRDIDAGMLTVAAPAPRPLNTEEWRRVVQEDGPMMASILCPTLGEYCKQIRFEPDDYVIVINATVLPAPNNGSQISLTTRMREIVERPGVPRREYPPPSGVRFALDKIWSEYERERAAQAKR